MSYRFNLWHLQLYHLLEQCVRLHWCYFPWHAQQLQLCGHPLKEIKISWSFLCHYWLTLIWKQLVDFELCQKFGTDRFILFKTLVNIGHIYFKPGVNCFVLKLGNQNIFLPLTLTGFKISWQVYAHWVCKCIQK